MPVIKELDRTVVVASGPSKVVVSGGIRNLVSVQSIARLNSVPNVMGVDVTKGKEVVNSAKIILCQGQPSSGAFLIANRLAELETYQMKVEARTNLELNHIDCGEFL